MSIMDWAAWSVIAGLSFISIGGLLIWAYGESMSAKNRVNLATDKLSVTARRNFAGVLGYSAALIVFGFGFLVRGTLFILS